MEVWLNENDSPQDVLECHDQSNASNAILIESYLRFLFLWQSIFRLSDVGLGILLTFFAVMVHIFGNTFHINALKDFSKQLPRTVQAARNILGQKFDHFRKWACCPSCSTLYAIAECEVIMPDGSKSSKECSHIRFPNHPQARFRQPCGTTLMKTVRTSNGTMYLYPKQMYCYNSLINFLKNKFAEPDFIMKCETWRQTTQLESDLSDVFSGQVWKDFLNVDGVPFLSVPYNFAFSLNVDWFQPYKRSMYSAGAIYLSVLNLPRAERFTSENILLVGVIPGPHEPELTINTFLKPLVEELLQLWDGVVMQTQDKRLVLVRAALLCVACDVPAARKVCGFCGHRALRGCSKCKKLFPTEKFGDLPDYSGFKREQWELRSLSEHREYAKKYQAANTITEQKAIERESGCRYSMLLELPYFDPIRMCIVDPMHNLLLGTARHMMSVWTDLGFLTEDKCKEIQAKVDSFFTPEDVGRIPGKLSSGFSKLTADQWRNWTIIYSLFCLKGILPHRHYNCWQLFVKACHLLCRRNISLDQVHHADELLMEFCETFQTLYGKDYCNINLHLHGHLASCILDYGPVYSFWLFPFERLNGILGSFHTNCHDISLQLMRRFLDTNSFGLHTWPSDYKDQLAPLVKKCIYNKGSLMQNSLGCAPTTYSTNDVEPFPPLCESALEPHQKESLKITIRTMHSSIDRIEILTIFQKCGSLKLNGILIGSERGRHKAYSIIMAQPLQLDGPKLAQICNFARCTYTIQSSNNSETHTSWFALASFFQMHQCQVWFGHPTQVWTRVASMDSYYLPISHLQSKVAYCSTSIFFGRIIGTDTVYVVVPV